MNDQPKRNPYRPGGDRVDSPKGSVKAKRPVGLIIAAGLETWTAVYTALTGPGALEDIREAFKGLGTELPPETRSLVGTPALWWTFAAVGVANLIWIVASPQPTAAEKRNMKWSVWIFGVVLGVFIGWSAYRLYSMIFKLGAVV